MLSGLNTAGLRVADDGLDALSERLGMPLERVESMPFSGLPTKPFSVRAYAADTSDTGEGRILRAAVADLARTLGRDFAPIAQLIASSNSPADALARVEAHCAKYRPTRSAQIIEEVELAFTANAAATFS